MFIMQTVTKDLTQAEVWQYKHLINYIIKKNSEMEVGLEGIVKHAIVSQLDKCLKLKSILGDRNDCTLHKITPEML